MISRFLFLFLESFRALFRAKIPAVISSSTIFLALIIFSISYFVYVNLMGYTVDIRKHYRIDVFFDPQLDEKSAVRIYNEILLIDGIEQGDFTDKARAAAIFEDQYGVDVTAIVGSNPLPLGGVFEVAPDYRRLESIRRIVHTIELVMGVEQVVYQAELIHRIDKVLENILTISFIIGLIVFFTAIMLVSNTIRLIIHAKQQSIATMKLLGAGDGFIRMPFILEGIWQGLIGALMSILVLWIFYQLLEYFQVPIRVFVVKPTFMFLGNLIMGAFLGLVGSYRSVSKYID